MPVCCDGCVRAVLQNKFQFLAVVFGIGQMALIALYLGMYVHPPDLLFVSDLLYRDTEYLVLMSVCVGVQMLFCGCYACRHRKEHPIEFKLMVTGLLLGAFGWATLNSQYLDPTNDISATHIAGVVMFVTGETVYFFFVVRDSCLAYWYHSSTLMLCRAISVVVIFTACLVMAGLFLSRFVIDHQLILSDVSHETTSWAFEHAAYLLFVAAHVIFFMYETQYPFRHKEKREPLASVYAPGPAYVPITFDDIVHR